MEKEFNMPSDAKLYELLHKLHEGEIRAVQSELIDDLDDKVRAILPVNGHLVRELKVEKLINDLKDCIDNYGTEEGHMKADEILLNIIAEYGHPEVKDIFEKIDKWYA